MKTKQVILTLIMIALISSVELTFGQAAWDTTKNNSPHSGIPNSGNTLYPNNGPESPHTSFPVQSTDPGPLFHGPSGVMFDSIPNLQHIPH